MNMQLMGDAQPRPDRGPRREGDRPAGERRSFGGGERREGGRGPRRDGAAPAGAGRFSGERRENRGPRREEGAAPARRRDA